MLARSGLLLVVVFLAWLALPLCADPPAAEELAADEALLK
jgi:hypothetical protein